jgi:hypothetical protein
VIDSIDATETYVRETIVVKVRRPGRQAVDT